MLLFRSEEHIARWYEPQGMALGETLTLQQQWDLARAWYSDRASPQWRRRTPAEAQEVFRGIGLTGKFWDLNPG